MVTERRRPVLKGDEDHHFKACFAYFVKRLQQTGEPEWQLLEGPPAPDALLAYHLLGLLQEDGEAAEKRNVLRAEAELEARTIKEATGGTADALDLEKAEDVRAFLRKC